MYASRDPAPDDRPASPDDRPASKRSGQRRSGQQRSRDGSVAELQLVQAGFGQDRRRRGHLASALCYAQQPAGRHGEIGLAREDVDACGVPLSGRKADYERVRDGRPVT